MSLSRAVLDAMLSAGCSAEQIVAVVSASGAEDEAREAHKREVNAARKRRQRENEKASHALSHDVTRTERDGAGQPPFPLSLDKEIPPAPPKEIKPKTPLPPNSPAFDEFWDLFPNKVGKGDASKAFFRAEQRVGLDELMAGLRRYVAKLDDRPWCNPATWLNQDRWTDQPAAVARGSPGPKLNSMQAAIERSRERRNADERQTGIASGGAVLKLSDFSVG